MRNFIVAAAVLSCAIVSRADRPIYDEAADAKSDIAAALVDARRAEVPVLLVFGANWCGDCKVLHLALEQGPGAPLIAKKFRIVNIDVGRFNRNLDIASAYSVPLKQGIPAVAVLAADGKLLYATQAGELANARGMDDKGIHQFFETIAARSK
jgi:protein disulfide-isomerase